MQASSTGPEPEVGTAEEPRKDVVIVVRTPSRRRSARFAVAVAVATAVVATGVTAWSVVPGTRLPRVAAADPTSSPTPTGAPSSAPSAEAISPTTGASPTPIPPPSASPTDSGPPTVTPASTESPQATPSAAPAATASAPPSPSAPPVPIAAAEVVLQYALSPGQQPGATIGQPIPLYRLVMPSLSLAASATSPHAGTTLAAADCASCHAAHSARGANLLQATTETSLCYRCHGSGSDLDVQSQLDGLPANDESTDAYYSHPVTGATAALHNGAADEFGNVLNRHAICADCHNPHAATDAAPQQSTTGWTASGAVQDARGVAVTNGAAAASPSYRLIRSGRGLTYEYELCLTCHSGWTTLPTRGPANPSRWALDKGIELNPANTSFHPIEAAGRNETAQMAASLAGTSPYKAWTFSLDATIRCTSCHGDPASVNQTASGPPLQPAAGSAEAPHGSPNRGLLTAPYRDRLLKSAGEAYASGDFALCYLCHAERPFVDPNPAPDPPDTLFPLHGAHLTELAGSGGSGTSIDVAGNGAGFAICAECHFRIHSTAVAYQVGDTAPTPRPTGNASLVGFAPNVTAAGGLPPTWTQPGASGAGSCTLTCHGHEHDAASSAYLTAPGAGFDAAPRAGPVGPSGLVVQFHDATRYADTGDATWLWQFGDGQTSTEREPVHAYLAPGTYTVTLTVTRSATTPLSSTLSRSGYVVVTP